MLNADGGSGSSSPIDVETAARPGGWDTSHSCGRAPSNARSCAKATLPTSEPATGGDACPGVPCAHTVNTPLVLTVPVFPEPPPVR
eukprot:scaffold53827_cov28-Tisochrysis_lutea.AAC.8